MAGVWELLCPNLAQTEGEFVTSFVRGPYLNLSYCCGHEHKKQTRCRGVSIIIVRFQQSEGLGAF